MPKITETECKKCKAISIGYKKDYPMFCWKCGNEVKIKSIGRITEVLK